MSSTKRRLVFASPFVVTALLSPACSHPTPKQPVPEGTPDARPTDGTPDAVEAAEDLRKAPDAPGSWSKVGDRWVFTYTEPRIASIELAADGSCWFDTYSICQREDDEVVVRTCNPPPPQPVQCPAGAPDPDE